MTKKKISAFTFKDTFWSRKRVDANISIVELAKLFGISRATMGAYLTGYLMPKDDIIKDMCEFFGVDFIEGKGEFDKAHKAWDADAKKTLKATAKTPYQKKRPCKTERVQGCARDLSDVTIEADTSIDVISVEELNKHRRVGEELLKLIYKKVSYEKYCVVADYVFNDAGDPLAVIYGIVDVDTFNKARRLLDGKPAAATVIETDYSKWEI